MGRLLSLRLLLMQNQFAVAGEAEAVGFACVDDAEFLGTFEELFGTHDAWRLGVLGGGFGGAIGLFRFGHHVLSGVAIVG